MASRTSGPAAAPPFDLLNGASLFLDFDGTLVELAERPDAIRVDERVGRLMRSLDEKLCGRLAVISGRGAAELRSWFDSPSFAISGSHGLEFCDADGTLSAAARPAGLDEVKAAAGALARSWPGVLVEDKPLSVALHFRQAPEAEAACEAFGRDQAARHGLYAQPGKMVVELRATGGDKGRAIRTLIANPSWTGTRPLFFGDDQTDEAGFEAAAALGGAGVLVGAARPTAARYRLADVEATLEWLEAAAR